MHCKVLGKRAFKRLEERGVDSVLYAPHHSMLRDRPLSKIEKKIKQYEDEFKIFLGKEISSRYDIGKRVHVVAVGLQENMLDEQSTEYVLEDLEEQGAASIIAHPYAPFFGRVDFDKYEKLIDGIEVENAQCTRGMNKKAKEIEQQYDVVGVGGSYAHFQRRAGAAWTLFDGEIEDTDELVERIKGGEVKGAGRIQGIKGFLEDLEDYLCHSFHVSSYYISERIRQKRIKEKF